MGACSPISSAGPQPAKLALLGSSLHRDKISIGPVLVLCLLGWPSSKLFHVLATADSMITTLIYLLLLHFDWGVKRVAA